jgi:ATP-binding cassette subfamily B protein
MAGYTDVVLFRRLLDQARRYWPHTGALFLLSLLASPLSLLAPLPLKIAVDSVIGSHPLPWVIAPFVPEAIRHSAGGLLALAVGLVLAVALLSQLQGLGNTLLRAWVQERLVLDFRARLFRHVQRVSLAYHDTRGTTDSTYRVQRDALAIQHILTEGLIPFVTATVTFVAMIYVMARIDWSLALIALAVSPGPVVIARVFRRRLRRQWREVKRLESAVQSIVQEVLGALRIVKAFGQEPREEQRFLGRCVDGVRARMRVAGLEGSYQLLVGLTTAVGTSAVLLIGIGHVRSGALTLGELLMVMGYLAQFYQPLRTMGQKAASLQLHMASAERAFALLDEPPDVEARPDARPLARAGGAIAFRNVSFAYGDDRPVLHDVSFDIGLGTRLGIAGASGAGKSTLISLLTRFYDPTEGEVRLDGVDLRDFRLEDLRRQFAVVLQDPVLFSTSIAENIGYAKPGATKDELIAAARAANAHEFIVRLPRGYDTQVGERGVQLSGGQRQRIAIARAFLKDSPVLILDEPTSAVDMETEAVIVEALERLQQGRTVIIISHRPTTLAGSTAVLTLEQGRVVRDTTQTLVETGPVRPTPTPAPAVRGTRLEKLLAHPAVRAWRRLGPDLALPDRISPRKRKPSPRRPPVYRLEGAGPDGSAVIAKGCTAAAALVERTVYEQFLAHLPLARARYYGCVEDPTGELTWLFLDEVRGEKYSCLLPQHRVYAALWLGLLHGGAHSLGPQAGLPDGGPGRYLERLRATRECVRAHLDSPMLSTDDVAFLQALLSRLDELEEHWDRLVEACAGMPQTLVHGDLSGKNVRVQAGADAGIAVFDWTDAGWGVPAADLAQLVLPESNLSVGADIPTYWAAVRERWPSLDLADVERVAYCGSAFRALAALEWDSHHLKHEWAHEYIVTMRFYDAELVNALRQLDGVRRATSPAGVS